MFSKHKNSGNQNSKFYLVPANREEVHSGYMYKSPGQTPFRSLKSWKQRFFVLSRTTANHYELTFFRDEHRREKPLGYINLYQVSGFSRKADSQPLWLWIQRNFKCSASCVLYMRASERDYFLIGENSDEMDDWFNAIFKALNTHSTIQPEETRTRSMSEPLSMLHHDQTLSEDQEQNDPTPSSLLMRQSAPASFNSLYSHYDYPKNCMMTATFLSLESEDTEDDEEDEMKINKESETDRDTSKYMAMASVRDVWREVQNEDVSHPQINLEGNTVSETLLHQAGNEKSGSTALHKQVSLDSETFIPAEKEICVSQYVLKNCLIFSEEAGRLCVSNWRHKQSSGLFHEGDQILAINDLLTDSLVELQSYLRRVSKDQVKVTILRQPGSQPLSGC